VSETEERVARGLAAIADRLPNDVPHIDLARYRSVRRRHRLSSLAAGSAAVAVIAAAWVGWAARTADPPTTPSSPRAFACPVGTSLYGNQVKLSLGGTRPKHTAADAEHVVLTASGLPGLRIEHPPYLATFALDPVSQLKLFKATTPRLAWLVAYSWSYPGLTQDEIGKLHWTRNVVPRPPSTRYSISAVDDATLRTLTACYATN
jgi:hypothetical protein